MILQNGQINNKLDTNIILNEQGQTINILPTIESNTKSKIWQCNGFCKTIDPDILIELKNLFQDLIYFTYTDVYNFLKNIDFCSAQSDNSEKKGHPITCYNKPLLCTSRFLKVNVLTVHYPKHRTIKRLLYKIIGLYKQIEKIENALYNSDVDMLKLIALNAEQSAMSIHCSNDEICLNEVEIKDKYSKGIKEYSP